MSEPGSGTANYLFRRPQKLSGVARNLLYDSERAVGKRTHVPGTYVQPVTACDTVAYDKGKHAHRHPIRCFLENHNRSLPGCYLFRRGFRKFVIRSRYKMLSTLLCTVESRGRFPKNRLPARPVSLYASGVSRPAGNAALVQIRVALRSSGPFTAAFSDFLYLPQMIQVVSREHADDVADGLL